jgi:hypothetical protein
VSGDYSRDSFDPRRHFSAVRMQQGRVALDADWNEQAEIIDRRGRAQTVDVVGRRGVPRETPDGFRISIVYSLGQRGLRIGLGRYYVDGLLAENHGVGKFTFDMSVAKADGRGPAGVLGEVIGLESIAYDEQPYWPEPDPLPAGNGPHLVYLDVWQREVTAIENAGLLEKALNGVDTTTRLQTVWQVRVLPDVGSSVTCATPESNLANWSVRTDPSAARLTIHLDPESQPDDPCLVATTGGYTGLENQLYRIEIHDSGTLGSATFKWSRDNASVVTPVEEFVSDTLVRVKSLGRDAVLGFAEDQWVELTDDHREFAQLSGEMLKIKKVDPDNETLLFTKPVPSHLKPGGDGDTPAARHTRIRRWDQAKIVRESNGGAITNLDATGASGTIPVPNSPAVRVVLENGLSVSFNADPVGGAFRPGDYWTFAARSIDATADVLVQAPPRAVHHHYAPLALIRFPNEVTDQRSPFNPAAGSVQVCSARRTDADGRRQPLRPGMEIPINQLADGLDVLIRQNVDPNSVNDGSLFVTTEIPYRLPAPYEGAASGAVVAYQRVVLPAEVSLAGDNVLDWRPFPQTGTFLSNILQYDVPRLGNVQFEREFEVFDYGGPASKWGIGPGNTVVQTEKTAGTRPYPQPSELPTMAVHRYRLTDNPSYVGLTVDEVSSGSVGLVYNWLSPNDFSLFGGREVWVPVGYSGAWQTLVMSHYQVKGGQVVSETQEDITVATGRGDPSRMTFDVKSTEEGLKFGYSANFAHSPTLSDTLDFSFTTHFIPRSRLGVLTAGIETARFTRLQVVYGDEPRVTLIPAGFASRLLSRLVLKRSLLQVVSGASGATPGGAFAAPVPEADFETYFWLVPPTETYYGYGGRGGYRGIGSGRLVVEGGPQ